MENNLPCSTEDAIQLAALKLSVDIGPYDSTKKVEGLMLAWNSAKANSFSKNYIPSDLHHLKSDKDFEEGIYNQHLKVL